MTKQLKSLAEHQAEHLMPEPDLSKLTWSKTDVACPNCEDGVTALNRSKEGNPRNPGMVYAHCEECGYLGAMY